MKESPLQQTAQQVCIEMKSLKEALSAGTWKTISDILTDHDLASLGDAYINFAYSLALSNRKGKPIGDKVKGNLLTEALRRAGLRNELPSRMTSHTMADAAEALIVYAWLRGYVTLEETVTELAKAEDTADGLTQLLNKIKNRIKLS